MSHLVAESTPVDGVHVVGALSPSRTGDFLACPLLYRFRTIDKLPEPASADAARGTLVHKVLEDLFDLPAVSRTPEQAASMLPAAWESVREMDPRLEELFPDGAGFDTWWASCTSVLEKYFALEDPRRLEPAERELYVETITDDKLLLRGIIDRIDVAPDGALRLVDYKSGRAPGEGWEAKALFQLKFYGLIVWRTRGVIPKRLQLIYLGSGEVIHYDPDESDLVATERKIRAVWAAVAAATESGDWQAKPSRLCSWCAHQALCPAYGGTPPPLPERPIDAVLSAADRPTRAGGGVDGP